MKPQRGTLEGDGLTFVSLSRDGELIVEDEDGKQEVWFQNDHTASYGLRYKGHVYEFARSKKKPNVPPWAGRVNPPRRGGGDTDRGHEVNPPLIQPKFGSVSTGTLKDDDLIEAFSEELEYLYRGHRMPPEVKALLNVTTDWLEDRDQPDDDDLVGDLTEALSAVALPYSYFGTLEGDAADFGFWPDIESLERAVADREVIKVNDTGDIPAKYRGDVMVVNDHGNVTFGYMDGRHRFREVWSVV